MTMAPEDKRNQNKFYTLVALSILAGIVILVVGFGLEFFRCNDWFARSGAMLVMFELGVAAWRLKSGTDDEALEWLRMDILMTVMPADILKNNLKKMAPEMTPKAYTNQLRSIYRKHTNRQRVFNILQIVLLACGTFVWAFGDLMVNFNKCPT